MYRIVAIVFFVSTISKVCCAQEVWLRPDKFFYEPGETASIQILTGDEFIGIPLPLENEEVSFLEHWTRNSNIDLRQGYSRNEKATFPLRLDHEGYQFLFFKTTRSTNPDASKFNEMLKQYGLDEIYTEREQRGALEVTPTLINKVFVQLALRTGRQHGQGWNKSMNLSIEVIPDKNPQILKRGERIHFTVLKNGKPAFGVRVKIWNRWDNRTTIQNIYTEKDGTISTTISSPGDWMVSVVEMEKGAQENQYVAESFNLVFGYR